MHEKLMEKSVKLLWRRGVTRRDARRAKFADASARTRRQTSSPRLNTALRHVLHIQPLQSYRLQVLCSAVEGKPTFRLQHGACGSGERLPAEQFTMLLIG